MAARIYTTCGIEFKHSGVTPEVGMRIGSDAAKRIENKQHSLVGAVVRLAASLARYGQDRTRLADGKLRHARRTAVVGSGSPQYRVTLETVLCAEDWYATHRKQPAQADLASMLGLAAETGETDAVRTAIEISIADASAEGETVRAEQVRAERRKRDADKRAGEESPAPADSDADYDKRARKDRAERHDADCPRCAHGNEDEDCYFDW